MWAPVMFQPVRVNGQQKELLDSEVKSAMGALRSYLVFMLSAQRSDCDSQEAYEEAVDSYCDELLDYCKSAQQDFCLADENPQWQRKSALCTSNLHSLVCWGKWLAKQRGPLGRDLELWVEMYLGEIARITKFTVHGSPEVSIARHYLLRCALEGLELQLANTPGAQKLPTVDELRNLVNSEQEAATSKTSADRYDDSSSSDGWLSLAGQRIESQPQWQLIRQEVEDCLKQHDRLEGWETDDWDQVRVYQHSRAVLANQQELLSTSYGSGGSSRNSRKDGTYFLVYYVSGSGPAAKEVPAVARAKYFTRIVGPKGDVLRLVIADFCHLFSTTADPDFGEKLCGQKEVNTNQDYPVLLDMIHCPVALVDRQVNSVRAGRVEWWRDYCPILSLSNRPGIRRAKQHKRLLRAAAAAAAESTGGA